MFCFFFRDASAGCVRGGYGSSERNEQVPSGGGALAEEGGGGQAEEARVRARVPGSFVRRVALACRFLADCLHPSLPKDR